MANCEFNYRTNGLSCSCGQPCYKASWSELRSSLQQSALQRRRNRCNCGLRPKWLRIRRKTEKKKRVTFEGCTCTPHICCQAMNAENFELSPKPKKICRFTVDAYFT